jgi:hypothetical protein
MKDVMYAGPRAVDPVVSLEWENGQTRTVDDGIAEQLLELDGFSCSEPGTPPRRRRFVAVPEPMGPGAAAAAPGDAPAPDDSPEREEG